MYDALDNSSSVSHSRSSSSVDQSSGGQASSERVFKALKEARSRLEAIEQSRNERIAIIGMDGRFPGADSVADFWQMIAKGESGIRTLSETDLLEAGISEDTFNQPNYVPAYASFSNPTEFDASFFGYSPRDAELMDPQHRVFLECAWRALEDAGYDSHQYDGKIGVYGGAALNRYINNLQSNPAIRDTVDPVQAVVSNVMGLMPTRVSYQLDLKGPSCGIQTGCSTALVAIHTACQSLLNHECDMALAGGVTISQATPQGYLHQPGSIASPDGVCRAFDADGQGTLFGNGVGIVVLKRLQAALVDGDHIYAVIKGSAINNDGADKVNLIAPSVSGQAAVIRTAIEQASIHPSTIGYVEGHGTGTPLGDPIEVAALNRVFSEPHQTTGNNHTIKLGSVKTNVGHLDAAAGAAGLIKATLALHHKTLPASLNYQQPNPQIDFQNGPFEVCQTTQLWPAITDAEANELPRRAGVSSFGMGGTNAHVILEEAPSLHTADEGRPWQLIPLSAKTPTALAAVTQNLTDYLEQQPNVSIADVAYTLQVGRRAMPYRQYCLCQSAKDAMALPLFQSIAQLKKHSSSTQPIQNSARSVVFMFPGQGTQHVDMAKGLYDSEPVFTRVLNECAELLAYHSIDLIGLLYPNRVTNQNSTGREGNASLLTQTAYAQPALFAVEYALAQLWLSWGVRPQALIGHSVGEYVAACIAGIFSLKDALTLMVKRGQLMQRCKPGSMLSVLSDAEQVQALLPEPLEIATLNSPQNCVVSGPTDTIHLFQQKLEAQDIPCRLLTTSHAFHSA
ncbi:MAG: type I polyketide synthase, partial [Cyanobacteria bacterium J06607_10]